MTNATVIKKIKQYSKRQVGKLYPLLYKEAEKQFFATLSKMPFKKRLGLAWRILRKSRISENSMRDHQGRKVSPLYGPEEKGN